MKCKQQRAFAKIERILANGMTIRELAQSLGYKSHSAVSNWFYRNRIPSNMIDRILKLKEKK